MEKIAFFLIILSSVSSYNDLDWNFCGTWRHDRDSLNLNLNISTGCKGIDISANESVLSVTGQITTQCERSELISLNQLGLSSGEDIDFCLYWEPLLDQLKLTLGGQTLTLCWPSSLQDSCCTDLTDGPKTKRTTYGIFNTRIKTDHITNDTLMAYNFNGGSISYRKLCEQANRQSEHNIKCAEPPYAHRSEAELKEDFRGRSITSPAIEGRSFKSNITVHLPPALKQAAKKANKVACTFFKNNSLLQEGHKDAKPISDVVEITVENEIIKDLSEPITIDFYHEVVSERNLRRCVSWDTRKDSLQVNWLEDGCETQQRGESHTVCLCNHLTYFTVLVYLELRAARHLLALSAIRYLGCTVAIIMAFALIVYINRKMS